VTTTEPASEPASQPANQPSLPQPFLSLAHALDYRACTWAVWDSSGRCQPHQPRRRRNAGWRQHTRGLGGAGRGGALLSVERGAFLSVERCAPCGRRGAGPCTTAPRTGLPERNGCHSSRLRRRGRVGGVTAARRWWVASTAPQWCGDSRFSHRHWGTRTRRRCRGSVTPATGRCRPSPRGRGSCRSRRRGRRRPSCHAAQLKHVI
jgi:hypothetical protein